MSATNLKSHENMSDTKLLKKFNSLKLSENTKIEDNNSSDIKTLDSPWSFKGQNL